MSRKFHFTRDSIRRLKEYISRKDTPGEAASAPAAEPALVAACLTDVGKVRAVNQDALIESAELQLYGVADGMGGHNGGETASAGARDALLEALQGKKPAAEALRDAVCTANARLFEQQAQDSALSGMGTTLSVVWMSEHFAYMAHVGDSRIYRVRDGEMEQLTDDHSLVGELVRAGYLTPEQAEKHPNRNVITRAVGTEEDIDVDMAVEERQTGDIWLICSDGLHGLVPDEEMKAALLAHAPKKAARVLMDAALKAGGRDNISVVVLRDGEAAR